MNYYTKKFFDYYQKHYFKFELNFFRFSFIVNSIYENAAFFNFRTLTLRENVKSSKINIHINDNKNEIKKYLTTNRLFNEKNRFLKTI